MTVGLLFSEYTSLAKGGGGRDGNLKGMGKSTGPGVRTPSWPLLAGLHCAPGAGLTSPWPSVPSFDG